MTAAAAAEKKRQLQELFYRYNSARGLAVVNSQHRNYKKAVSYYTQAAEAVERLDERLKLPLILARSIASCKDEDLVAAREDIDFAKETAPEDISVIENDAYTLLAQNEFEHAMVQYATGCQKRIKPDTCDTGVKVCRSIIRECIGETAGPLMDMNNLGKTIIDIATAKHSSNASLNSEQRQALCKKIKIKKEKLLGEIYFPGLQNDKEFLQDLATKLQSSKKSHGKELFRAVNEALLVIEDKQKSFMAHYPMYVWAYNKPKLSSERQNKVAEEKMRFKKGATTVIRRLETEMHSAYEEENDILCFRLVFRTERYITCHCTLFISETHLIKILEALYNIVGELYLRMKKMQVDMSDDKNEQRIYCMLGIEMPDTRFIRKIKASLISHVLDKSTYCKYVTEKLKIAVSGLERTFWCHELAACLSTTNKTELAQKFAIMGYKYAMSIDNTTWIINNGFLIARAYFLHGDLTEARDVLTEIITQADIAERPMCKDFLQKVTDVIVSEESEQLIVIPPVKKRQREIINLMPNHEMKEQIEALFLEMDSLPEEQRFSILPKTEVDQTRKKRHIRLTMATKRHTIDVMRDTHICTVKPYSDARPTFVV